MLSYVNEGGWLGGADAFAVTHLLMEKNSTEHLSEVSSVLCASKYVSASGYLLVIALLWYSCS